MITLKSSDELTIMARAGSLLATVVERLEDAVKEGVTTLELDRLTEGWIRKGGAVPGFKGFQGYPCSICTSVNDQVVHAIPNNRRLRSGDILSLDLGLIKDGFWADCGSSVIVGRASSQARQLVQVTREALDLGIAQAKVGNRLGDISAAIQEHVEGHGYSVVREMVGHGIGREMHEDPPVPNYGVRGSGPELRSGMTLAIEPMVNLGRREVRLKADGWTVVTADGSLSAYFEHTVAITEAGPWVLTARDSELGR